MGPPFFPDGVIPKGGVFQPTEGSLAWSTCARYRKRATAVCDGWTFPIQHARSHSTPSLHSVAQGRLLGPLEKTRAFGMTH